MARTRSVDAPELRSYRVVGTEIFHHPGGVALPGDVLSLSPADAERGIAIGRLVPHSDAEASGDQE